MTGSQGDEHLVLAAGDRTLTLAGPVAAELRGWPGSVCVSYDDGDGRYLGAANAVRVVTYRLQGDGMHAPIVGRLARRGSSFALRTDDGKTFAVRGDATQLAAAVGRHIWLLARWSHGALEPLQLGLLGAQAP